MKRFLGILLLISLLTLPMFSVTPANTKENTLAFDNNLPGERAVDLVTPGPDLARANWTHNHFANPSFELWDSPNRPAGLSGGKSFERYHWYDYAHSTEGTRSGGFQCRSLDGDWSQAFYQRTYIGADVKNLTLQFDWWLDQNFDHAVDHDLFYLYLDFSMGYQIIYYLNGSETYAINGTYTGVFRLGGPEKQWNLFDRNVTDDFLKIPDFPSSIPVNLELEDVEFHLRAYGGTKEYVRVFIDDVQLVNTTNIYIDGVTRNGGFESDFDPWYTRGNSDPGLRTQSSLAHGGAGSLNLTSLCNGNYSYVDCGYSSDVRLTTLNPAKLQFWWRLEDVTNPTHDSNAFVELQCYNSTDDWTMFYLLSHGDTLPNPNYQNVTYQAVFYADSFNTTGSWNLFSRDLLADITTRFSTDELFIMDLSFRLELDNSPSSRIVLLVDEVSLNAAAVNGMGYEDQPAVGENVRGWHNNDEFDELTVTDVAYAGNKAANLTVTTGNQVEAQQEPAYRPLNGTRETYFDFIWRLEAYTPGSQNFIRFSVGFGDEYSIDYMLAVSSDFPWTNTTTQKYLNVSEVGITGTWIQSHIDLVNDYEAVFGVTPNTNITFCSFNGRCDTGGRIEFLWDDLYLYDDPAPTVGNVNQNPAAPEYDETVDISADASDQDLDIVLLHYSVSGRPWQTVTMAHQSGDTFQGTIPSQSYNQHVEYYVSANDTWGMPTTALDSGQYYSYIVGDSTGPSISIIVNGIILVLDNIALPSTFIAQGGIVNITSTVTDPGSGVSNVEITIDNSVVFTGANAPFTYLWDANFVASGSYTINVTALDNAGNTQSSSISFMVQNPLPQLLIAAAVIIVIVVVIVVVFFLYRFRKQKDQEAV